MEFGVGIKFHGTFKVPWNSMEFHGTSLLTWKSSMEFHGTSGEFHGIPWNSMELWNIDINKFHNWGSVFHCFLYDFMSLYIRQSISCWNIEIFQFQSNFLVPLILVKWRYSILNGGLFLVFQTINRNSADYKIQHISFIFILGHKCQCDFIAHYLKMPQKSGVLSWSVNSELKATASGDHICRYIEKKDIILNI